MTTIAYKDGVIAYDSRISADNLILDDEHEKHIEKDGIHFFLSGSTGDWQDFIDSCCAGLDIVRDLDVSALIIDQGKLYRSSIEKIRDGFRIWKSPIRMNQTIAVGSGRDFAIAFMDAGLSAYDAVVATTKRDMWTGGIIRIHNL